MGSRQGPFQGDRAVRREPPDHRLQDGPMELGTYSGQPSIKQGRRADHPDPWIPGSSVAGQGWNNPLADSAAGERRGVQLQGSDRQQSPVAVVGSSAQQPTKDYHLLQHGGGRHDQRVCDIPSGIRHHQ